MRSILISSLPRQNVYSSILSTRHFLHLIVWLAISDETETIRENTGSAPRPPRCVRCFAVESIAGPSSILYPESAAPPARPSIQDPHRTLMQFLEETVEPSPYATILQKELYAYYCTFAHTTSTMTEHVLSSITFTKKVQMILGDRWKNPETGVLYEIGKRPSNQGNVLSGIQYKEGKMPDPALLKKVRPAKYELEPEEYLQALLKPIYEDFLTSLVNQGIPEEQAARALVYFTKGIYDLVLTLCKKNLNLEVIQHLGSQHLGDQLREISKQALLRVSENVGPHPESSIT